MELLTIFFIVIFISSLENMLKTLNFYFNNQMMN
jgi:hypothetical protein